MTAGSLSVIVGGVGGRASAVGGRGTMVWPGVY